MKEYVREYLIEMLEYIKVDITDDISDTVDEYSESINDGYFEGYFASSNYVADCNLEEYEKSESNRRENSIQKELDAVYSAIRRKGFNLHYDNGKVYESGIEHAGGTISASYKREIR